MMSGATAVRSHAKINLGLYIGAPRADGFHSLTTVYQTLALHDVVTVRARAAAATCIRLTSNDGRVPTDGRNTAWKMVELALGALGLTADVEIHIDKRLPVQGGLGAGSANAVAALVGLEVELGMGDELCGAPGLKGERWGTGLSQVSKSRPGAPAGPSTPLRFAQDDKPGFAQDDKPGFAQDDKPGFAQDDKPGFAQDDKPGFAQDDKAIEEFDQECKEAWGGWRLEIAARVGSDVPLFLIGGTVLGLDRGQAVSPLPEIEPVWCVVATPDVGVSTAQAFRDWDALCGAEGLTAEASADRLNELSRAYASAFSGANDFSGSIPGGGQGAGSSGVLLHEEDLAGPNESALVRTGITSWIENDFERVVFRQHPSLSEIKRVLAASGRPEAALYASLSGSGSALYGLYRTRGDAEAACRRLGSAGVRSLLTRTLPRAKYWREMLLRKD